MLTDKQWKEANPAGIIQNGKRFLKSTYRPHIYMWVNRPEHTKNFDYYMCSCGIIRSNCGFAKHRYAKSTVIN